MDHKRYRWRLTHPFGMRRLVFVAFLFSLSESKATSVLKSPAQVIQLADLPLRERCIVAKVVASQVLDVVDAVSLVQYAVVDGLLNLFISNHAKKDSRPNPSIFRKGEDCGSVLLHHSFIVGEPLVGVTFATGAPDELPDKPVYSLIFTEAVSPGRWKLSWRLNDGIGGCPPDNTGQPTICTHPTSQMGPGFPTLKITIVKNAIGDFTVEQAMLDLIRHASTPPPLWTRPIHPLAQTLTIGDRCALLTAIVNAPAEGSGHSGILLSEQESVKSQATWRGKLLLCPSVSKDNENTDLPWLSQHESCPSDAFAINGVQTESASDLPPVCLGIRLSPEGRNTFRFLTALQPSKEPVYYKGNPRTDGVAIRKGTAWVAKQTVDPRP